MGDMDGSHKDTAVDGDSNMSDDTFSDLSDLDSDDDSDNADDSDDDSESDDDSDDDSSSEDDFHTLYGSQSSAHSSMKASQVTGRA